MKLINKFDSGYGFSSLEFGMVKKATDDTLELVVGFKPCRDYLHDVIRCQLHGGQDWYSGYDSKKHAPVDLDKFRLILALPKEFSGRIEFVKTAINLLENEMKLEDKMQLLEITKSEKGCTFLLEGDKVWISDPHLMSLISLVTRWIILRARRFPENMSNISIDELLEWFRTGADGNSSSDVTSYMPSFLKKAKLILTHHKEIFHLPIEEAYPNFVRFTRDDYHSKGGIHELCNYNSKMHEIENKMKEIEKMNV